MKNIERSFKDLFALCLKRWVVLVIGAAVGAVAFAVIQYSAQMKIKNDPEMSEEAIEARYQEAMKAYNKQIDALDKADKKDQATIKSTQEYIDNSLLMMIDPNNKCVTVMDIAIDITDDEVFTQNFGYSTTPIDYVINKIQNQYMAAYGVLDITTFPGLVKLHPDLEKKYWNEVFSVQKKEAGVIEILAYGSSTEETRAIVQTVYDVLEAKTDVICQTAFPHSFIILSDIDRVDIDKDLETKQNNQYSAIKDAETRINDRVSQRSGIEVPVKEEGYSMDTMVNAVRSFALIGIPAGIVLAMFVIMLHCVAVKQVITSREIELATGVMYLGAACKKERKHKLPSDKISGERVWKTREEASDYILAALGNDLAGKKVLLTSSLALRPDDVRVDNLQKAFENAESKATVVTDALYNAEYLRSIKEADIVVFMEQAVRSRLEMISDMKKTCESEKKENVGFVMLTK